MIYGDYHTHTVFSHGKGSIIDNVRAAHEKGLKQVAITDHGLRHIAFGMRPNDIFRMKKIIEKAQLQFPDVKILYGVEANVFTSDGRIDLKPKEIGLFDIVLAGFHKFVWPKTPADMFRFYASAFWHERHGATPESIEKFTYAFVKAITSGNVDVITHLNYCTKTDVKRVAQAAKDYGVLIELNGKRVSLTDEEILTIKDVGAKFIINSDAHSADRIGDVSVPLAVVERLNLDKNCIANWEQIPMFQRQIARSTADKQ